MQSARKINQVENYFSENVIEFKLKNAVKKRAKKIEDDTKKVCFQTDQRYRCKDNECSCSDDCKKLIAAWMR